MKGKTVLVTGASSGIGLEAAADLAVEGATVVIVARNSSKGEPALAEIRKRSRSNAVSLLLCDFSSQASVRAFAASFRAAHTRLDVLVNNAGTISQNRVVTTDGFELTFAVNHLAPFLLTTLLLDLVERSAPSRIVNVASEAHRHDDMDFANLQFEHGGYSLRKAYNRSKLANVLFTNELARRLDGKGVTANSVHPGVVATNIWNHTPWYLKPLVLPWKVMMLDAAKGAETVVYLATSPEVEGKSGGYYRKRVRVEPSPLAMDRAVAARLWDESSKLTGRQS
jgi:NAD(P)-dependent dehydrogenase (short-subunit alcohol dehydrogenase family)